jgi:copper chaperone
MTRIYRVPGISCAHCKQAIEREVGAVAGVDRVEVDIEQRSVTVDGDTDDGALRDAIDEAGYDVAAMTLA